MSTHIKDNEQIFSNQKDFKEAYTRACQVFGKIEGVVGVGFGQKEKEGEYNDQIAIVVFVKEKKSEGKLPLDERIPPSFEGYATDVRIVLEGTAEICDNESSYDRIQGGIQIMLKKNDSNEEGKGTLGCIVKKRGDKGRENVYLLTNKHVLYSPDFGAGATVYHPTLKGKSLGSVQEGGWYGNYPYPLNLPTALNYFIDCAIARIDLDEPCCCCTCKDVTKVEEQLVVDLQINGVNSLSDVRDITSDISIIYTEQNKRKVFKVGRTTGKTTGKIMLVNAPLIADPAPDKKNGPNINAENTILIIFDETSTANGKNCKGQKRFTAAGDSGSIIVDENNCVIGIHSHRSKPMAGTGIVGSHACHILPVLEYLGICIPVTTGTSRGSSLATDGSGVAPARDNLGDFPVPDGEIVFASQQVEGVPTPSLRSFETLKITDDEVVHIHKLLDTFRITQKGRELHDIFTEVWREIGYLIRNCRPVKVIWHRNKGPAFFAHVLNHLKGDTEYVPQEVNGVKRGTLLMRMGEVLTKYGSDPLRQAIEQHGDDLIVMLSNDNYNCVQDCISYLQEREST
jgi:hypothetical protein